MLIKILIMKDFNHSYINGKIVVPWGQGAKQSSNPQHVLHTHLLCTHGRNLQFVRP